MKVLYITSGFNQSYPHQFIDRFITSSFTSVPKHQIKVFHFYPNMHNWGGRLISMVRSFQPNYVFTIHGGFLTKEVIQKIKEIGPIVGIWFVDDPYDIQSSKKRLYNWDFIFTNEMASVAVYKSQGYRQVYYLPLGVQTQIYFPETVPHQYYSDLFFVGTPFPRRVEMIKSLLAKIPKLRLKIVGPQWQKHLSRKVDLINRPLSPDQIRKFYNGAKINLNIHRDDTEHVDGINLNPDRIKAISPNNRIFDICACNSFQLVDFRPGLRDYFNMKNDLITYNNTNELILKIKYFLKNHLMRKNIANNGYKKVMGHHRMESRVQEMIQIIERNLKHDARSQKAKPKPQLSHLEGQLIKGERPAIYLVKGEKKHLISSLHSFEKHGFHWKDVQIIPQHQIEQIPTGEPLT